MSTASIDRIVLVGFMGAGKSSVGALCAARLQWRFVDTDQVVEDGEGRSIPEIFTADGEDHFRTLEARVTRKAVLGRHIVVATGGGWPMASDWRNDLPPGSLAVWLDVTRDVVLDRVGNDLESRPLLSGAGGLGGVSQLMDFRRSYYSLADVRVDTDGRTVDDVTAQILVLLGGDPP